VISLALYLLVVAAVAANGVFSVLLGPRTLGVVLLLGPLASMVALQLAICVSSRVNDARTAQQLGIFVILPIPALLLGQIFGGIELTGPLILWMALGLFIVNVGLMWVAVRLFDRETILTRWK
jgi:ABC-2 type transport system permease protein